MSTSRIFHLMSFKSRIVTDCYFALVTNADKTRVVHETGMYSSRYFAKHAAKEWAEKSQSKKAKSLEPGKGK